MIELRVDDRSSFGTVAQCRYLSSAFYRVFGDKIVTIPIITPSCGSLGMNSLRKWRWAILVCILAIVVGVMHGMTHVDFHEYYTQLLDDIDELFELTAQYLSCLFVKLGYSKKSNKLKAVADHYDLMVNRAQPLLELFSKDLQRLVTFMEDLESVHMIKKFLYSYFRQSAINLIDHLKRVYNL